MKRELGTWSAISFCYLICGTSAITNAAGDIAAQLANPVASLISAPIQVNYDENYGVSDDGSVWRTNIQPVIPISIGENWNLISRTILPVIDQDSVPSGQHPSGIGDVVQSVFFSPKAATDSGLIWGVGPVFLLPTATDDLLGTNSWGGGPTAVVLKQDGPWTYGFLGNHIESFAGSGDRIDVSATFLQPFLTYITASRTTLYLNTESTYDWEREDWSVPVNFGVNQLLKVGDQLLQVGIGGRYWAESTEAGPEGWGLRFNLIFVFPK